MTTIAVVPAAGAGARVGAGCNKLLLPVLDRPLLAWTLQAVADCPEVDGLVVVVRGADLDAVRSMIDDNAIPKVLVVCAGGASRHESVARGLAHVATADFVVIHDGARPLVTPQLIGDTVASARRWKSGIAAIPVTDTVRRSRDGCWCDGAYDRRQLWAMQTPQTFCREALCRAHEHCSLPADEITDDATVFAADGHRLRLTLGDPRNIKVTHPHDLELAAALLRDRAAVE